MCQHSLQQRSPVSRSASPISKFNPQTKGEVGTFNRNNSLHSSQHLREITQRERLHLSSDDTDAVYVYLYVY